MVLRDSALLFLPFSVIKDGSKERQGESVRQRKTTPNCVSHLELILLPRGLYLVVLICFAIASHRAI